MATRIGSSNPLAKRRPLRPKGGMPDKSFRYTLVLLGLCLLFLGLPGFYVQNDQAGEPATGWQVTYRTVQLFFLNSGGEGPDNFFLVLARLAAIGFVVLGMGKVVATIYRATFDEWWLCLARRHAVICGLGRIGIQLCRDLRAQRGRRTVVAVERDEANPNVRLARELGATVLIGDARDPELLRSLRLERAQLIFAVAGSDSTNVEIAIRTCELLPPAAPRPQAGPAEPPAATATPSTGPEPPADPAAAPECDCQAAEVRMADPREFCYVHIADPARTDLLSRHPAFARRLPGMEVRLLNVFERSAWELVEEHLAGDRPDRIRGAEPPRYEAAHYAIVGFGQMGQTVALTAARLAQFENRQRLRLTILDDAIEPKRAQFLAHYPRFCPDPAAAGSHGLDLAAFDASADCWSSRRYRPAPPFWCDEPAVEYACNAEFLPIPGDVDAHELVEALIQRFTRPDVHPALIVCFDDDTRNFDAALALQARLQVHCPELPIYVWLPSQPGLARLLEAPDGGGEAAAGRIVAFGECERSCRLDRVFRPHVEFFARGIYEDYRRRYDPRGPAWEDLAEVLRFSNYLAAEHIAIKLRVLGCEIVCEKSCRSGQRMAVFSEKQSELLSEIEHNRWLAERLIDGWSYGNVPAPERLLRKKNRSIVPWECLDDERRKDFTQVGLIPELVGRLPLYCHEGRTSRWCIARLRERAPTESEVR